MALGSGGVEHSLDMNTRIQLLFTLMAIVRRAGILEAFKLETFVSKWTK